MEAIKFVGFILPPFIDLINRKIANSDARFWIAVAVCTVIGSLVHFIENGGFVSVDGVIQTIFVVLGTSQITYKGIYEDSKAQLSIRGI